MKQRFDPVPASRRSQGDPGRGTAAAPTTRTPHAQAALGSPAPASVTWLSEALKIWCADLHAPH